MTPEIGHNSTFAKDQLKAIIERVENVETEIKERQQDRSDIYKEASGNGFNAKAVRVVIRKQRADKKKASELAADVDAYMAALGMVD